MDAIAASSLTGSSTAADAQAFAGRRTIGVDRIIAIILALCSLTHILLWRLLDWANWPVYAIGLALVAGLTAVAARSATSDRTIPLRTLLWCLAIAAALLLLGGEGRLLYLNYDWQVRDAVLGDLIRQPWPFVYTARGTEEVLRAPLGMYLWPALFGKIAGPAAADLLLLVQNSFLLGCVLALGSILFPEKGRRWLATAIIVLFSGMDILGGLAVGTVSPADIPAAAHIEHWLGGLQFSSHFTQLAWVPQHGWAGWVGALLFLLWRLGHVRVGPLLAAVPLVALWSPMSALGIVPFAAWAGLSDLLGRKLKPSDWALPALATVLSVPGLFYLVAGGDSVGFRLRPTFLVEYAFFLSVEVAIALLLAMLLLRRSRFGDATVRLTALVLALTPLFQIGEGVDFSMRVSIPALAIVSVLVADALWAGWQARHDRVRALIALALAGVVAVGTVTPLLELGRAVAYRPPPRTACSLIGSWDNFEWDGEIVENPSTKSTYLAPVSSLPAFMRPAAPSRVPHEHDPAQCWPQRWRTPR